METSESMIPSEAEGSVFTFSLILFSQVLFAIHVFHFFGTLRLPHLINLILLFNYQNPSRLHHCQPTC